MINRVAPVELEFAEINWPDELILPWDYSVYEEIVGTYGPPYVVGKKGGIRVNEPFFAAKFSAEHLVLFEPGENRLYAYEPARGLWIPQTEERTKDILARDMKTYADTQDNESFVLLGNGKLSNIVDLVKGQVERRNAFKEKRAIHVANGMLHLDRNPIELRDFSPKYYSRNQCPVQLVRGADCPRFKQGLVESLSDEGDRTLLQRWCGAVLLGRNQAQRFAVFYGPGGSGKSTIVAVVEMIIGVENVTELRTDQLNERFEAARFTGKTLLTGKDVPPEFLMHKGAAVIKKLTGGDLFSPEFKNANGFEDLRGEFHIAISSNSNPRIRVEGDAEAWRRRLLPFAFPPAQRERRVADFGKMIVQEEGPGILNWMLQGAMMHQRELRDHGDFLLSEFQKERIDRILAESDSVGNLYATVSRRAANNPRSRSTSC
ncbi:MAG: phage/plasmid primase, P4 family [Verrucomicrobiia bacterium]